MNTALATEEAKQMVNEAMDRGKRAFGKAERRFTEVRNEVADSAEELREDVRHQVAMTRNQIRQYPLMAVGLGIAAGACLGALVSYAVTRKESDHDHSCCI